MPNLPPHPCAQSRCPRLTHRRYCEAHERVIRQSFDRERGSAASRGYGRRWQRLRKLVLARQPICQWPNCMTEATEVDHIKPRRRGGDDSLANLQALCKAHHSLKTVREDGRWGAG